MPEKIAAQQNSLERDEKIYEQLQKLRSVKDNVSSVKYGFEISVDEKRVKFIINILL